MTDEKLLREVLTVCEDTLPDKAKVASIYRIAAIAWKQRPALATRPTDTGVVERVARAIAKANGHLSTHPDNWELWVPEAEAALASLSQAKGVGNE